MWCYNDAKCFKHGDPADRKAGTCPGSSFCASDQGCDCTSCDDAKCKPTQDAKGAWHSWQLRSTDYVPSTWRPDPSEEDD